MEIGTFRAALYCHLWPVPRYTIFFLHYLINGTIFEKNIYIFLERKMCVLIFSTTFVRKISRYKQNSAR